MKNNFVVKCIAVVLFAVFMSSLLLSGACIVFGVGTEAFFTEVNKTDAKERLLKNMLWNYEYELYHSIDNYVKYDEPFEHFAPYFSENVMYEIVDGEGKVIYTSLDDSIGNLTISSEYQFSVLKDEYKNQEDTIKETFEEDTTSVSLSDDLVDEYDNATDTSKYYDKNTYTISIYYKDKPIVKDNIYYAGLLFDFIAVNESKIYFTTVVSAALSVIMYIFIMCAAGHNEKQKDIYISRFDEFPVDILTVIYGGLTALLCIGIYGLIDYATWWHYDRGIYEIMPMLISLCVMGVFIDFILLGVLSMTSAVRLKTKTYIKSTIIYKIIVLICRILKKIWTGFVKIIRRLWKSFAKMCKGIWSLLRKIPLVWKTVLIVIALGFLEIPIYVISHDCGFPLWFIFNIVLGVFATLIAIILKQIKKGTEEIAKGNIYKKINTKYMFLDFKDHAENINNMSDGIARAVAEQMKSERFKTELITNVSHDIKTPLTSIINYVDLLEKEEIENETAKEYIDVLSRQSTRLKKLIEDLLEASKASTGNINVNLLKFELGILLTQALGEYEERFTKNNLQVVLNKTDEMLFVMADNRHMWRVFDNILNNIAKYAQSGTRVYIDAKHNGQFAEISFRNISKDPLNISGDELMERFVRGDSSRNTEGSGLGLSIAKSLTEVQKGKLEIEIDGDLFKVRLSFPLSK